MTNAFTIFFLFAAILSTANAAVLPYRYSPLITAATPTATIHSWEVVMSGPVVIRPAASSAPLPSASPIPYLTSLPSPGTSSNDAGQSYVVPANTPAPTRTTTGTVLTTSDPISMYLTTVSPTRTSVPSQLPTRTTTRAILTTSDRISTYLEAANPARTPTPSPSTSPLPPLPTRTPAPSSSASSLPPLPTASPVPTTTPQANRDEEEDSNEQYHDTADEDEQENVGDVPKMYFVESETGRKGSLVRDGFKFCPNNLSFQGFSVLCDYLGASSATFLVNQDKIRTETARPFAISGYVDGEVVAWSDYHDGEDVQITCVIDGGKREVSATGRFSCE